MALGWAEKNEDEDRLTDRKLIHSLAQTRTQAHSTADRHTHHTHTYTGARTQHTHGINKFMLLIRYSNTPRHEGNLISSMSSGGCDTSFAIVVAAAAAAAAAV